MSKIDFVFGGVSSLGLGGLFIWVFKESLSKALSRSLQREMNQHKHDLDIQKEFIKLDIQKSAYATQLATTNIYEIYPTLIEKIRIAEGALHLFRVSVLS